MQSNFGSLLNDFYSFFIDFGSENREEIGHKSDVFWQVFLSSFLDVGGRFFLFFSAHRCFCALGVFDAEPSVFLCCFDRAALGKCFEHCCG